MRRIWAAVVLLSVGCGTGSEGSSTPPPPGAFFVSPPPPSYGLSLEFLDESGAAIPGAEAVLDGRRFPAAPDGTLDLDGFQGPVVLIIEAAGFLPEPVVLGPDDAAQPVAVRLKAVDGPGGRRRVFHFGGDIMLGRRYQEPIQPDTALVFDGPSARAAVAPLAPLFRAAHLSVANLETVIGTFPRSAAYPKKRFLLQSPPALLEALDEVGLDLAVLGNNHVRDWLEPGLQTTLNHLATAGIPTVGAGMTEAAAGAPAILDVDGLKVGVLSYTSIIGDFVNDAYPRDTDPVPFGLPPSEAWQYEFRSWGHGPVPTASRRLRGAWDQIKSVEGGMTEAERAALWTSAIGVYPELQDWVARRGHGGANNLDYQKFAPDIAALRAAGCDYVIVQLHAGHQYTDVCSVGMADGARRAIDVGADLVIGHHAHVQQGYEFYRGKLICFSLGNCVFDQDFLSTFITSVLRVVVEGTSMVEARVYPMTIHRYRPTPVVGRAARKILRALQERSAIDARSEREGLGVLQVLRAPHALARKPAFALDGHSALLREGPGTSTSLAATATRSSALELPEMGLTRSRGTGLTNVLFGRDLFRWGSFEDETADGDAAGGPHWFQFGAPLSAQVAVTDDAPSGARALRLYRHAGNVDRVRLRPVARVIRSEHRLYAGAGAPADGPATYSLRFKAKFTGTGQTRFTFDVYNFDDANPSEDPESFLIRTVELPFLLPNDGDWREAIVDLPSIIFAPFGALPANSTMFYVGLHPPAEGESELWMDDLELIEWRDPLEMPDGYFEVSHLRAKAADAPAPVTLQRREE